MATTYLQAAQAVARLVGGSAVTAQITVAKAAVLDAIRDFDSRHDWDFKMSTLSDITTVVGTATYDLVTAGGVRPKKIHSARMKGNKRTLYFVRQREWDRVVDNQESNMIPTHYTEVRSANGNLSIKLLPTPSAADSLQVRVYEHIVLPSADGDNIDIPDRYMAGFLALARYYFIIDRDAEDARAVVMLQKAEQMIQKAIQDDMGAPDEDIRLVPADEWAASFGFQDPITQDLPL